PRRARTARPGRDPRRAWWANATADGAAPAALRNPRQRVDRRDQRSTPGPEPDEEPPPRSWPVSDPLGPVLAHESEEPVLQPTAGSDPFHPDTAGHQGPDHLAASDAVEHHHEVAFPPRDRGDRQRRHQ